MHHEKNPIIFYLDLEIIDGKSDGVKEFADYLVAAVNETEPKTMYYKYWFQRQKNVSTEAYHSNEDAISLNAFKRLIEINFWNFYCKELSVLVIQMMIQNAMEAYTNDHRTLMNGFQEVAQLR